MTNLTWGLEHRERKTPPPQTDIKIQMKDENELERGN